MFAFLLLNDHEGKPSHYHVIITSCSPRQTPSSQGHLKTDESACVDGQSWQNLLYSFEEVACDNMRIPIGITDYIPLYPQLLVESPRGNLTQLFKSIALKILPMMKHAVALTSSLKEDSNSSVKGNFSLQRFRQSDLGIGTVSALTYSSPNLIRSTNSWVSRRVHKDLLQWR
jgi:hypothetical protein